MVRIADDLPAVEVDAATAELCLTNYTRMRSSIPTPRSRSAGVEGTGL